jgi:hypothetical protein
MEISPALLAFLGAIIGAMIGATVAPFVQWQIEKRRQRMAYRRELIATWRKLFEDFTDGKISGLPDEEVDYMLAKRSDFVSFMAHSKIDWKQPFTKSETEFLENASIHPMIFKYLEETVRLEKEWKLI